MLITSQELATVTNFTFVDSLGNAVHANTLLIPVVYGDHHDDLPDFLQKLTDKLRDAGRVVSPDRNKTRALPKQLLTDYQSLSLTAEHPDHHANPRIRFHGGSVDLHRLGEEEQHASAPTSPKQRTATVVEDDVPMKRAIKPPFLNILPAVDSPNPASPSAWTLRGETRQ